MFVQLSWPENKTKAVRKYLDAPVSTSFGCRLFATKVIMNNFCAVLIILLVITLADSAPISDAVTVVSQYNKVTDEGYEYAWVDLVQITNNLVEMALQVHFERRARSLWKGRSDKRWR